ncbi:hypothetical protein FACS189418_7390 [Clostridia bacterium]|nr:hypothetical protein FACS189418_7390 [Clostridia bacterium]
MAKQKENQSSEKNTAKKSWWKSFKAEFKRITWPTRPQVIQETSTVITISFALGVLIAIMDMVIKYGLNQII